MGSRMLDCIAKGRADSGLLYYYIIEGTSEATEKSNSNCSSSEKLG